MNRHDLLALPTDDPASRRRLLRVLAAGGAALAASLLPRSSVRATHGGGTDAEALHIGHENAAGAETTLFVSMPEGTPGDPIGLQVAINRGRGIHANSGIGVGVWGHSETGDEPFFPHVGVEGTAHNDGTGVRGQSKGGEGAGSGAGAGVVGESGSGPGVHGTSEGGPGVAGNSDSGPAVQGFANTGSGVEGSSDAGTGVSGSSQSGSGVDGHSVNGPGGSFHTDGGNFAVHISGNAVDFALGVDNGLVGEAAGGIFAISRGGKPAIEGDGLPSEFGQGVGVQGVSGTEDSFGQGPGVGVQGISGTGVGVQAISADGTALEVQGKARFSTAGSGVVPAGQSSVMVANPAVTDESHVTVTPVGDPGNRFVRWVQRHPGQGFTVHFSPVPPPQRPATPFTYLIVELGAV